MYLAPWRVGKYPKRKLRPTLSAVRRFLAQVVDSD